MVKRNRAFVAAIAILALTVMVARRFRIGREDAA